MHKPQRARAYELWLKHNGCLIHKIAEVHCDRSARDTLLSAIRERLGEHLGDSTIVPRTKGSPAPTYGEKELLKAHSAFNDKPQPSYAPHGELVWIKQLVAAMAEYCTRTFRHWPGPSLFFLLQEVAPWPRHMDSLTDAPRIDGQIKGEDLALVVLRQHPDWTDTQIAKHIGVARQSLYRWRKFRYARNWQRGEGLDHRAATQGVKRIDKRRQKKRREYDE